MVMLDIAIMRIVSGENGDMWPGRVEDLYLLPLVGIYLKYI